MAFDALYRRAHAENEAALMHHKARENAGFAAHAIEQCASRASGRDWVIAAQGLKNARELARVIKAAAEKLRALSRSNRVFASGRTGATAVAAAMRPWHGPATANAKRLRRK